MTCGEMNILETSYILKQCF